MSVMAFASEDLFDKLREAEALNGRLRSLGDKADGYVSLHFDAAYELFAAKAANTTCKQVVAAVRAWKRRLIWNAVREERVAAAVAYSRFSQCVSDAFRVAKQQEALALAEIASERRRNAPKRPGRRGTQNARIHGQRYRQVVRVA